MISSPLDATARPSLRFTVRVGFVMVASLFLASCESTLPAGYGVIDIILIPPPDANYKAVALVYTRNPDTLKRTILSRAGVDRFGNARFMLKHDLVYGIQVFWDSNANLRREANEVQASIEGVRPLTDLHSCQPIAFDLPP